MASALEFLQSAPKPSALDFLTSTPEPSNLLEDLQDFGAQTEAALAPQTMEQRAGLPEAQETLFATVSQPFVQIPRPEAQPSDPAAIKFTKGLAEAGIGLVEGIESPLGVGLAGATAIPTVGPVIGRTAALGFGTHMVLEGFKHAAQAYQEGDFTKAGKAVGDLLIGSMMQRGAFAAPRVAPRTTEALKQSTESLGGTGELLPRPKEVTADASKVQETTTVHADVPKETVQGTREMPVPEGGQGVQPGKIIPPPIPEQPSMPLGITPKESSAVRYLRERSEGEALIDQQRIQTAEKPVNVMPGRDYIASPEFEFRKHPVAKELVTEIVERDLSYAYEVGHDRAVFEQLRKPLSEPEQRAVTNALKAADKGNDLTLRDKLSPASRSAYETIRSFYDQIADLVHLDKEQSIRESLSEAQIKALDRIDAGETFDSATAKLGDTSKAIIRAAQDEIAEAKDWGIENYTTFMERGNYKVIVPEQGVVAVGRTRAEAAIKADKWLKEHPEVASVLLDDSFASTSEFPTKLSRGQYWRLVDRLKDATDSDAKAIQDLLHSQGSIVAVKPTKKYAAPMLKRRNVLKGEENVFDVLPVYSHIMRKKLALDPILRRAPAMLEKLPEPMRGQIEELIADVKGRKFLEDKLADALLQNWGLEPFAFSRASRAMRQGTTVLKLGYRPVAALVNRLSGLNKTWVKSSAHWIAEGQKFLKTPEGKSLIESNKPYIGMESSFAETARDVPIYHPMGMFQKAERINRPEAFATFYKMATDGLKMPHGEAVKYARDATRLGQFTYNTASLPRLMRSPSGRLLLQFKPYLVKELEFISTLSKPELAKYTVGFLLMGGPRAALAVIRSLPVLGALGVWAATEDWLNQEAPRMSRGAPGALGVDMSPSVAFQFPDEVRDWIGPVLSDIHKLYADVIKPALEGENRGVKDVLSWVSKLAPIVTAWKELVSTFVGDDEVRDERGRLIYTPTQLDRIKMALGAKPLERSIGEVERRYLLQTEAIERRNKGRLIGEYVKARQAGNEKAMDKLIDAMREAGVSSESVRAALREAQLSVHERTMKRLSKERRAKESERE